MPFKRVFFSFVFLFITKLVISQTYLVAKPNANNGLTIYKTSVLPENVNTNAIYANTIIQKNRPLVRRKLPNDPFIPSQKWITQLKVESVWEKYNSQITKNGDSIIVAVIDDGIDSTHPDLIGNLHINYNEIPWNGIDDDSNGYIDDYRGWNTVDCNGLANSFYNGEHGTPIAGIIAAKGNNSLGITGINWNCKLLNICVYGKTSSGDDLSLVNGLIYVLNNKKLFKSSKGKKGINTHIISLSVGLDRTKPEDAPLWCYYLGELAKEGVLVCAAVTNSTVLIDIAGDIPAMCLTDNLISVNSAYDFYTFSGQSKKYVHISADGTDVYSTKEGSSYSQNYTGTSFSAPQVAGVAALHLQAACKPFLNLLADSPIVALKLWKSWLLTGDKKTSLKNISISESTLNAKSSIEAMENWCKLNDSSGSIFTKKIKPLPLFPNPIQIGNTLNFNTYKQFNKAIFINTLGQTVHTTNKIPTNCPNLATGVYTILLYSQNEIYQSKIQVNP